MPCTAKQLSLLSSFIGDSPRNFTIGSGGKYGIVKEEMASQSHEEMRKIQQSLERRGISSIYHYTRIENLPSIFRHGGVLCSAERRRLGIMTVGGDWQRWGSRDRFQEMEEYVACSLEPPYGMLEKDLDAGYTLALCDIKAGLISRGGTLFCPAWSSYREFNLEGLMERSTAEHFDGMFPNPSSSEPKFYGAEILVKVSIPLLEIQRVYFTDKELRDRAIRDCTRVIQEVGRRGVTIYFVIRPEVFKRPPDHYLKRQRFRR